MAYDTATAVAAAAADDNGCCPPPSLNKDNDSRCICWLLLCASLIMLPPVIHHGSTSSRAPLRPHLHLLSCPSCSVGWRVFRCLSLIFLLACLRPVPPTALFWMVQWNRYLLINFRPEKNRTIFRLSKVPAIFQESDFYCNSLCTEVIARYWVPAKIRLNHLDRI